jgi:cyclophilin family peptidyl-prolyl cis-trans isomerase
MTASIPQQLQGTQAPSQVEILWEKNRRTITLIAIALLVALGLNYVVRYFAQAKINKTWSAFAVTTHLDQGYDNQELIKNQLAWRADQELGGELARELPKMDQARLDKAVAEASADEKPFLLWTGACQAILKGEEDRAKALLAQLQSEFPKYTFSEKSKYPVQYRQPKDTEKDKAKSGAHKKPDELEPPQEKSMLELLRDQLTTAQFQEPANFKKPAIPEDAPKYRVETTMGDFTIALFDKLAPKHAEEIKKLVEMKEGSFWAGMRVDEIHRTGTKNQFFRRANEFHFGLEGSKEDDRTLWTSKTPSTHQIDYEHTDLSHFPGAVSGSPEGTKSSVDRLWISVDDNVTVDGTRVVFGYVVDGMDVIRKIGEAVLATQGEEEGGSGKPQDNITIKSVKKL